MIAIRVDLGHIPSVLEAFRNPHNAQRLANALAESYNDDIHEWIAAGSGFTPRPGGSLEQKTNWEPVGGGYIVRRSVIHKGSRPHPYFFADQTARGMHMQEKGLSVLAGIMAGGGHG